MAIQGNTECRRRLKDVLQITEPTLYRYLTKNDDNLTKAAALQVIREELNLSDTEILEELDTVNYQK